MEKEIIDKAIIDPNVASYEQFFDHDWCKRIFESVGKSPLKAAVDTLMIAWRSTNGAHLLPWLMVQCLRGFAEGECSGSLRLRAGYSQQVVKGIVNKLEYLMQNDLNRNQRRALKRAVSTIEGAAFQALKTAETQVGFDVAGYWEFLVRTPEFHFCILGTQRINYGALFFAYEDFLASVIRTREPAYSSKKNPIKDAFAKHFGDPLTDYCWSHEAIDLARLVRHALAHNGGRFGTALDKYKAFFVEVTGTTPPQLRGDLFNVVEGNIQITPCNTEYLFSVLKERVTRIVEELA